MFRTRNFGFFLLLIAFVSFAFKWNGIGWLAILVALVWTLYMLAGGRDLSNVRLTKMTAQQYIEFLKQREADLAAEIQLHQDKLAKAKPLIEQAETLKAKFDTKAGEIFKLIEKSKPLSGNELEEVYQEILAKRKEADAIKNELDPIIEQLNALHLGE